MKTIVKVIKYSIAIAACACAALMCTREVKAYSTPFYIELAEGSNDAYIQIKESIERGSYLYSDDPNFTTWTTLNPKNKVTGDHPQATLSSSDGPTRLYFKDRGNSYTTINLEIVGNSDSVNIGGEIATLVGLGDFSEIDLNGAFAEQEKIVSAANLTLPEPSVYTKGFASMFRSCTALKEAPRLPATDLCAGCYEYMFQNCTALEKAPDLPATTLTDRCYRHMFDGCNNLKEVHVSFTSYDGLAVPIEKWLPDVNSGNRKLYCPDELRRALERDGLLPEGWSFATQGSPSSVKSSDNGFLEWLITNIRTQNTEVVAEEPEKQIDRDTFKSEAPAKTVIALESLGAKSFFDLKVHAADDKTKANQKFLVQTLVGPDARILLTENIYPARDLSASENGMLQTLTWNNLPKNQAGPVYAVIYNQTDKAYEISGVLDANGTAVFSGFKLRSASTISICK